MRHAHPPPTPLEGREVKPLPQVSLAVALLFSGCVLSKQGRERPEHFTGIWTEYYEDGKKKSETSYKNGEEDGRFTRWYENGQKAEEGEWRPQGDFGSIRVGAWTTWHRNGRKESETFYRNGEVEGRFTEWYEDGQKAAEGEWRAQQDAGNIRVGVCTTWHKNGTKKSERVFRRVGDKSLVSVTEWHENGQTYLKGHGEVGLFGDPREGKWTVWSPDGTMVGEGIYRNGEPLDGMFQVSDEQIHEDGSRSITFSRLVFKTFRDGKPDGPLLIFDRDWRRLVKGGLKDGKPHGDFSWWNKRGEITAQGTYRGGQPWSGTFEIPWKEDHDLLGGPYGQRKMYQTYRDGGLIGERMGLEPEWPRPWGCSEGYTGVWLVSDKNRQTRGDIPLANGTREGKEAWWDANGTKIAEGIFKRGIPWDGTFYCPAHIDEFGGRYYAIWQCKDGLRVQVCVFRAGDGFKEREINFRNGKAHGKFIRWYDGGRKWVEATYAAGRLHGPYTCWHYWANDQKKEEGTHENGKRQGLWRLWNRKGKLLGEWVYRQGKPWEGAYVSQSSGSTDWDTYCITTYEQGKPEKKMEQGHCRGELSTEGELRDGRPWEGTFFRDGRIETYENGKLTKSRRAPTPQ